MDQVEKLLTAAPPDLRGLADLLGFPAGTAGGVVRDGPSATVAALAAARFRVLADVGWDVPAAGLFGAPPVTVVVGERHHPDLPDALRLLGLGASRVYRVRVDGQGRMRPTLIPPLRPPAIVCTQLGTVASGAPDPVAAVCAEVHDADAWVHVDGGFGLWGAASPVIRNRIIGVWYADSWTLDGAAALGVPEDGGLVFARDAEALRAGLVRPGAGAEVCTALAALGGDGVAEIVERACRYARRFAAELDAAGYRVLNEVVLNRVLAATGDAEGTGEVVDRVRAAGGRWCAATVWQGRPALCVTVGRWCASDEDLDRAVALVRAAQRVPP